MFIVKVIKNDDILKLEAHHSYVQPESSSLKDSIDLNTNIHNCSGAVVPPTGTHSISTSHVRSYQCSYKSKIEQKSGGSHADEKLGGRKRRLYYPAK